MVQRASKLHRYVRKKEESRQREREKEKRKRKRGTQDGELVRRKEDRKNRAEHSIAVTDYKSDHRPADIYLHTGRESGSRGSPPLLSRPTLLTSRCFSAWQPASPKSGCPPARPSRYFPSSPTHYSSLVLYPRRPFSRRSSYYSYSLFLPLSFFFFSSSSSRSFSLLLVFSLSGPLDVPLVLATSLSFPSTRSNVLVARGSSVRRPSCIPEPPHCSFLEGKRENISARRRRDARGESKVEGSRVEDGEEGKLER